MAASAGINLGNFGKVLKEKAKADLSKVFQGTEKTREKMGVVDELLAYWKLGDSEDVRQEEIDGLTWHTYIHVRRGTPATREPLTIFCFRSFLCLSPKLCWYNNNN